MIVRGETQLGTLRQRFSFDDFFVVTRRDFLARLHDEKILRVPLAVHPTLEQTEVTAHVTNLFDARYETAGYVDYPAPSFAPTPVWIPAATRAFFVGVKASL